MVANDARLGMESDENELMILFRKANENFSRAKHRARAGKIFQNSQQNV
jgi:hypothetical protein